MPTIFAIDGADFADFADFGAAPSQPVAELQTALKALGSGVKDTILRNITVDGVIGPKTTSATNRALTVHVGAGQAAARYRTGSLSQEQVRSEASMLASIIGNEAARRGYGVPTTQVIKTVAKKTAPKAKAVPASTFTPATPYAPPQPILQPPPPVAYIPPAPRSDSQATIVKYSAIGLGLVLVTGVAYYFMRKPTSSMAGFGAEPSYKTFIRSAKSFSSFARVRKHTVGTGLTYDEASRAARRFNAERSSREIKAGKKMEFIQE